MSLVPCNLQEIEFIGSFGMQPTRYNESFRMVERGRLDPSVVVSETISPEDVPGKTEAMDSNDTVGIPVCNEFAIPDGLVLPAR